MGLTFNVFSQTGVYVRKPDLTDGNKLKWTITLNADGTFLYHFLETFLLHPQETQKNIFMVKALGSMKESKFYFIANHQN